MRELKFRVWFEPTDEYKKEEIELGRQMPADMYAIFYTSDDLFDDTWCNLADYKHEPIIEQYTGIKDKNGQRIYEGDILELPIELSMATFGVVKYGYGEFYIEDYKCKDGTVHIVEFYEYNNPEKDFAVAGNIHENPELLKGEL